MRERTISSINRLRYWLKSGGACLGNSHPTIHPRKFRTCRVNCCCTKCNGLDFNGGTLSPKLDGVGVKRVPARCCDQCGGQKSRGVYQQSLVFDYSIVRQTVAKLGCGSKTDASFKSWLGTRNERTLANNHGQKATMFADFAVGRQLREQRNHGPRPPHG